MTPPAGAWLRRAVEPVSFRETVRFWDPAKQGGLAVVDVPQQQVSELGGLRQQRVHGELNGPGAMQLWGIDIA